MLKLYGGKRSRASIVQWYLEELNVPYDFVQLDMKADEHRQPEFLALNPMGKVPVLQNGDFVLAESGAILLYLAQQYDPSYPISPEQQAELYQWVIFANSTLAMGMFIESSQDRETKVLLGPLSDRLLQQTYTMGESFTVADIALGSMLAYILMLLKLDLSLYPGILAYKHRLSERPAFQKTIMGLQF